MFAPVDPYDPTLTVEDLDDLFGARGPVETDPTLDVSSLGDFFSTREAFDEHLDDLFEQPPAATQVSKPRPALVLVRSRQEPADISAEVEVEAPVQLDVAVQTEVTVHADVRFEAVSIPEPMVTPAPARQTSEAALSAIQRAVLDFERFAETFHAFAVQSQGLRTF